MSATQGTSTVDGVARLVIEYRALAQPQAAAHSNDGGRGRNRTLYDAGLEAAALPMSYTPVPAGGIEPPHDGSTTRRLPTWLSRQDLIAEAGIEPAADEAYETSALPTELFRGVAIERTHRFSVSCTPTFMWLPLLGSNQGPPSSKPGALPARRRGKWCHVRDSNPRHPI
jgi:hypothetical protein